MMYVLPSTSQNGSVSYPVKLKWMAFDQEAGSYGSFPLKMIYPGMSVNFLMEDSP